MEPIKNNEYNELFEAERSNIRRELTMYDSWFKNCGKNTFKNLLNDIDKGKASQEDIFRRVTAILQIAILSNRIKNSKAKELLHTQGKLDAILTMIQRYKVSYSYVYVVDRSDLEYFDALLDEGFIDEAKELYDLFGTDTENMSFAMNIVCNNNLYFCVVPNLHYNGKHKDAYRSISLYSSDSRMTTLEEPIYTAEVGLSAEHKRLEITYKNTATMSTSDTCKNCKQCKDNLVDEFDDGSRRIKCNWIETNKCKAFSNRLRPEELLQSVLAVVYAFNHRNEYVENKERSNIKLLDSQTKENNNSVIIYIRDTLEEVRRIRGEHRTGVSHVSPREHQRKGCMVRYKSGKIGYRKGCTVNKGKEKTTYEVRVSKKVKNRINNEDT